MSNNPSRRPAKKTAAKKTAAPRPKSLRAALAAKKVRRTFYDIPLVDSAVADELAAKVRRAEGVLSILGIGDSSDAKDRAAADQELADAKSELAACFHRVYFEGLQEEDFDALVNEHPPTAEQADEDKKLPQDEKRLWNADTFIPALLAECYVGDDGLTADEWATELKKPKWTRADVGALVREVMDANRRSFSDGIPKD
jgi:hypothetical protein